MFVFSVHSQYTHTHTQYLELSSHRHSISASSLCLLITSTYIISSAYLNVQSANVQPSAAKVSAQQSMCGEYIVIRMALAVALLQTERDGGLQETMQNFTQIGE